MGIPCFIKIHFIVLFTGVAFFTYQRQYSPPAKISGLILLWWSGTNPHYLKGMPVSLTRTVSERSRILEQSKDYSWNQIFLAALLSKCSQKN